MGAKAEIRNPKSEIRKKSEIRNPKLPRKSTKIAKEGKIMRDKGLLRCRLWVHSLADQARKWKPQRRDERGEKQGGQNHGGESGNPKSEIRNPRLPQKNTKITREGKIMGAES